MAPPPGPKRKRGDIGGGRQDSYDGSRPSPHRPSDLSLAQRDNRPVRYGQGQDFGSSGYHQNQQNDRRTSTRRGPQRAGRGGTRGGVNTAHNSGHRSADLVPGSPGQSSTNPTGKADAGANQKDGEDGAAENPKSTPAAYAANPPPPPPTEPSPPSIAPLPYDYEFLTDDQILNWADAGRAAVIAAARKTFDDDQDSDTLHVIFQELLRAGLDARIQALDAGSVVAEILLDLPSEQADEAATLFLDILSIVTDSDTANPRIRPLVISTNISSSLMREQLEEPLLQTLGLIRSTFARMFIRKQTHQLYKQSNYNLLREETEGYSKLVTELFTTTNSQPPSSEVVEETFENVKALIGAFDLDAGRVLDVTLDVFANLLVKHYRFFVRLLRQSSWWPDVPKYDGLEIKHQLIDALPPWAHPEYPAWQTSAEDKQRIAILKTQRDEQFWIRAREIGIDAFFELGGRQIMGDHDLDELIKIATQGDDIRTGETREWIRSTRTLPPPGNAVAAQLLGFKLRFYASSARDTNDQLPVNLIYLAALLIKIGFISLRDLYPHLFPQDTSMGAVKDKAMKERDERERLQRPGGGGNALARAGALVDDTLPPPVPRLREPATRAVTPSKTDSSKEGAAKSDEEQKPQLPDPADQKVELLKNLLCIGAIPEALFLFGRFPWLQDGYPDLIDHIHRIIHYSLNKVYEPLYPLVDRSGVRQAAKQPALDQTGIAKGDLRLVDAPVQKVLQWAKPDKKDVEGVDYVFYWHDWANNIPACQNVDDVFTLCNTLLNLSGVKIGQDPSLMTKLIRIGKDSLSKDFSDANQSRWIDLCKRLLVPALSLTGCNPALVNEMYDLLKLFNTPTRYGIYTEWFLGSTSRLHDIENAFAQAKAETKDILRRISKTNTKPMARALAKAACASPGIVFQIVLGQIESYINFIDLIVDCGRYFTYMGYDVLTWTMLTALGRAGRSRVKDTGVNTSLWLTSLSSFSGKVFRRYAPMTSLPILQHVLTQLRGGNFIDLQLLRELCVHMGGIAPDTDFTDAQVQAMAGGDLLQSQTLKQVTDKRHEGKIPAKRLMKTLVEGDLIGSLLVSIAQNRQTCVFNSNQNQVKIVGENFDAVHIVLIQFLDLIRHNLSVKEFNALVPDVVSLISEYGIDSSIAFTIHRKSITKAIEDYDAAFSPAVKRKSDASKANGNAPAATLPVSTDQDMVDADATTDTSKQEELNKQDSTAELENDATSSPSKEEQISSPWHPVLQEVMDRLSPVMSENFEASTSMPFFVSFWQLSINDLMLPTNSYAEEELRQKDRIAVITADRSDMTSLGIRKKEAEKKQIRDFLGSLSEEMKSRISKHKHVRARLEKEKEHWFVDFHKKSIPLCGALLQDCFLPRILISPLDSFFSWRMLNMMHSSGTPGFRTMHFIDLLMREKTLTNLMFQCTGREAENFGRFLCELLKELGTWRESKTEYEKKAYGPKKTLPGFIQKYDKDGGVVFLTFDDFKRVLYKWHMNLTRAARSCLDSNEYMHIKNCVATVRATSRYFPVINWMGQSICEGLKPYLDNKVEARQDVNLLSNSLYGFLQSKSKNWMLPQAFRPGDNNDEPGKPPVNTTKAGRPAPVAPKSPLPEAKSSKPLDAEAPEFQPKPAVATNGNQPLSAVDGKLENGEPGKTTPTNTGANDAEKQSQTSASERTAPTTQAQTANELRQKVLASKRRESQPESNLSKPATPSATAVRTTSADPTSSRHGTPSTSRELSSMPPRQEAAADHSTAQDRQSHPIPNRPDSNLRYSGRDRDRFAAPERPPVRGAPYEAGRSDRVTRQGPLDPAHRGDHRSDYRQDVLDRPSYTNGGPNGRPPSDRNYRADQPQPTSSRQSSHGMETVPRDGAGPASQLAQAAEAGPTINPARAALIGVETSQALSPSNRPISNIHNLDDSRNRRSRPPSPSRSDARSGPAPRIEMRRDDRQTAPTRPPPYDSRARDGPTDSAPNGPRLSGGSRSGFHHDGPRGTHDLMQPPNFRSTHDRAPHPFQQDSQQRQPARQHDESYGRLNADNSLPSSPQGNRLSRSMNAPGNTRRSSTEFPSNQPSVPPSSDGRPISRPGLQPQHSTSAPQPQSNDSTASGDVPNTGIHPSRMAAFDDSASGERAGPGGASRPPPIQTSSISSAQATEQSSAPPPSGPRSGTVRGGEVPMNSPSGPRQDRRTWENGPRRFQQLNDTLSSGAPQGAGRNGSQFPPTSSTTIEQDAINRGRQIQNNLPAQRPQQGFPSASSTPHPEPPQQHLSRSQMSIHDGRDVPSAPDDHDRLRSQNRDRERDRYSRDGERPSGTGRGSYRSSREGSQSRDPGMGRGERDLRDRSGRGTREYRDRDEDSPAGGGRAERDSREAPRDGRDLRGGRDRGPRLSEPDGMRDSGRKRGWGGEDGGMDAGGSMKRPRRGGRE